MQLLGLLAIVASCKQSPSPPAPAPTSTVIEREPTSLDRDYTFRGCNYDPDPVLAITFMQVLLDGIPVDEAELEAALKNKQALNAVLGAPAKDRVVVQVAKGVSESRVSRFLAAARAAGFVKVIRLADVELPGTRSKKHQGT